MRCKVTLKDGKTLEEADFYNWLHDNIDQLKAEGKIDMNLAEKEKKLRESIGIKKNARTFITNTVKALNNMVYGAEAAGAKLGASYAKKKIDALQKAAYDYLDEVEIKPNKKINGLIVSIRNEKHLANFVKAVAEKEMKDAFLGDAADAKKAIKDLKKAIKNTKAVPAKNATAVKNLPFVSPLDVRNPLEYKNLLENLEKSLTGKEFSNAMKALEDYLADEKAYIEEWNAADAEFNAMVDKQRVANEYDNLKREGLFEGTDIESLEDWEALQTRIQENALSEKDSELLDVISKDKSEELRGRILEFYNENRGELVDDLGRFGEYPITEEALSDLSYDQLVYLSNVLQNVLYNGDLFGAGTIFSRIKKKGLINEALDALRPIITKKSAIERGVKSLLGIKSKDISGRKLHAPRATMLTHVDAVIKSMAQGANIVNHVYAFLKGKWEGAVAKARIKHTTIMNKYAGLYYKLGNTNEKRRKAENKTFAYAFVNQWNIGFTEEQKQAHIAERIKTLVDNAKWQQANTEGKEGVENIQRNTTAKDILNGLREAGFIDEEGNVISTEGTLTTAERNLYNYWLESFRDMLPEFKRQMEEEFGIEFNGVENYFPTFTYGVRGSDENITPSNMATALTDMAFMTTTPSTAKERTGFANPLTGNRAYNLNALDVFSKGLWNTIMVADMGSDIQDMKNVLLTNVGADGLTKLGLTHSDIRLLKDVLDAQVLGDMTHGNIPKKGNYPIAKETLRFLTENMQNFMLKRWTQAFKQSVSLANIAINHPKAFGKVVQIYIRSFSDPRAKEALNNIIQNTSAYDRVERFKENVGLFGEPLSSMSNTQAAVVRKFRQLQTGINAISDGVTPIVNAIAYSITKQPIIHGSIMQGMDAQMSLMAAAAGYISATKTSNLSVDELIDLMSGELSEKGLSGAENAVLKANALSNSNAAAKITKDGIAKLFYFMGTFSLQAHQEMLTSWNALTGANYKANRMTDLTREEWWGHVQNIASYIIMQAAFRTVTAVLIRSIMADDDDKDKYFYEKAWSSAGAGLLADMFGASFGTLGAVPFDILSNYLWDKYAEEERKKYPPNEEPQSISEKAPLQSETRVGFSIAQAYYNIEKTWDKIDKRKKELDKANAPEEDYFRLIAPLVLNTAAMFTGMGWESDVMAFLGEPKKQREAFNSVKVLNKELFINNEQYVLSPKDMSKAMKENLKPSNTFVIKDDKGIPLFLVVYKEDKKLDDLIKEAARRRYGVESSDIQAIMRSDKFLSEQGANMRKTDDAKLKYAWSQIKEEMNFMMMKNARATPSKVSQYKIVGIND